MTGFEPAHPYERYDLNIVRLPISPHGQSVLMRTNIARYSINKQMNNRLIVFTSQNIFIFLTIM